MSEPKLDPEALSSALMKQGTLLEAEAFFICRGQGWQAAHGYRYGEPPETREIDVLASHVVDFVVPDTWKSPLTGRIFLPIECKHAAQWWVFVDLSKAEPGHDEFVFAKKSAVADRLIATVVSKVMEDLGVEGLPDRAWSWRELTFGYESVKREQFYPAFRQTQSATTALMDLWPKGGFSSQNRFLGLAAPTVMTNRPLVIARTEEGSEKIDFVETDWLIAGPRPNEMVHVVSPNGLTRLIAFLDAVVDALGTQDTHDAIVGLFKS